MYEITFGELIKNKKSSITEISQATGISRSTLTLLKNGTSKGIQFDTLEKICTFLECTPNDLIKTSPDSYIVEIPQQPKGDGIIYAIATRYSVVSNARKNNMMYNADKEDKNFYIIPIIPDGTQNISEWLSHTVMFIISCSRSINVKESTEKEIKAKEWILSLDKKEKISICKQSASIYLNNYWNRELPKKVYTVVNDDPEGNMFSFNTVKDGNNIGLYNDPID